MSYTGQRGYIADIKILFHLDYYDGMISGVGEIDSYKVYFEQISTNKFAMTTEELKNPLSGELWFSYHDPEIDTPEFNKDDPEDEPGLSHDIVRFFYVYDISPESMQGLLKRQNAFEEFVGNHNTYINNLRSNHGQSVKNIIDWDSYKAKTKDLHFDYKKELVFRNRIGYFDSNTIVQNRKNNAD